MPQIYLPRKGDSDIINEHLKDFKLISDKILIRQYNRMVRLGLMYNHSQKLYVLSLRIEFLLRFKKTPILFEKNFILSLKGQVEQA